MNETARYVQAIKCLSPPLFSKLVLLTEKISTSVQEIRLRINRPIAIITPTITYYLTLDGGLTSTPIENLMQITSKSDILDTFHNICNYSVYAKQDEISNGFVTISGGHRAGICGTAVFENDKITNIRDISSINIRISNEYKGSAQNLIKTLGVIDGGILICGPPCSGKTTVLRDMARILSLNISKNIALIDERGELAGTCCGIYQNDIGMCDVFDGYKKSVAMLQAIRSMSPDIIICDEIGSDEDIQAIESSVNCGVTIIASVHSANESELMQKKNIKKLFNLNAFNKIVFLSGRKTPGEIVKILKVSDVFDC